MQNLDLNEAQQKEIRTTVREYRGHLMDLREAVQRADSDLQVALDQSPLDQRKANEAIEHLATARGELTRTISQMTLRLRTILTNEQWQELQRRQAERRPGPFGWARKERALRATSGGGYAAAALSQCLNQPSPSTVFPAGRYSQPIQPS